MKIKKGDTVKVIAGNDRGKTGSVVRVLADAGTVVIDGINMKKKHQKKGQGNKAGQIIELAFPIAISNVMVIDPDTKKPSRIGFSVLKDGKKIRIAKKSGKEI